MNTPTIHSLLRWCWTQRFPVLFTAVVTGLLMPSFSASPPGGSRKVIDLRTGKPVENVVANGTIYQFQATVPKVNLWQAPLPLEGVWIESADKSTLTWISSHSGGSGDSTDCGGSTGGGAGDCPTNYPTCNGVPYDPITETCCGGQVYDNVDGCCVDDVWYSASFAAFPSTEAVLTAQYNDQGVLVHTVDKHGDTTSYRRDGKSRLVEESKNGKMFYQSNRDVAGRLEREEWPGSRSIHYAHETGGRVIVKIQSKIITYSCVFDPDGKLVRAELLPRTYQVDEE